MTAGARWASLRSGQIGRAGAEDFYRMTHGRPELPDVTRRLHGSAGLQITLCHYSAGERHDRHEHDHVQVSFLLSGGIQETIGRRCNEMTVPSVCIKPAGTDHEDLWGRSGALMLSVRFKDMDLLCRIGVEHARWIRCRSPSPDMLCAALSANSTDDVDSLAVDLLAVLDTPPEATRPASPSWINRVVEAIWDKPNLTSEEAAGVAGVHRVHLSRAFVRHLGLPFSIYRKHVITSRAVEALLRSDEPLADVAARSGFADQSHMHRTIRDLTGATPRHVREAFLP